MKHITSPQYLSYFRSRARVWALLLVFSWSFLPSGSLAQQPTATIHTVTGTVLINGQQQGQGTVINAGDILETQGGTRVTILFSDGSQLEVGENTKVDLAVFSRTATGGRVSRIKLVWGRIRAALSPDHQQAGSSFNIETPNAIVGVKFSQPYVEVSYDPATQETIGIAHTVELMAKNLLTDEEKLVKVGTTVIISGVTITILAGTAVVGVTSGGMSTGTKVVLGVGAAAAVGGVAAIAATSSENENEERCTSAECTGDLSGTWTFAGSCVAQGCTENTDCMSSSPYLCGTSVCDICNIGGDIQINQADHTLSGSCVAPPYISGTLHGIVDGKSVSFTTLGCGDGAPIGTDSHTSSYTGTLDGNTIRGNFSGSASWNTPSGGIETATWEGTFTVNIEK